MKKILFTAIILVSIFAQAQFKEKNKQENLQEMDNKKFGWGFWLAGNNFSFFLEPDVEYGTSGENYLPVTDFESGGGFSVGLLGKIRVHKYIDLTLEPGMHFVSRKIFFNNPLILFEKDRQRVVKSTYFEIPLSVMLHGERWGNTRPYIKGGVGYAYNAQSNEKSTSDNADGTFRMTTHNFNWNAELGIDIYFNRFKLTPFLRGLFFINNEVVADDSSTLYLANSIDNLKTQAFIFGLKFQ